jgi:hypothetical protein
LGSGSSGLGEVGLAEQPNLEELAAASTRYAKEHLALRAQCSLSRPKFAPAGLPNPAPIADLTIRFE